MRLLTIAMNMIRHMSVFDISIYKTLIYSFGILLAMWIPALQEANPLIYVVIALLLLGYLMTQTYKSRKDTSGFLETSLANFHEYGILEAACFEIGLLAFTLAIVHYVPWFLTIDMIRYVGICFFCLGRMLSILMHQKK